MLVMFMDKILQTERRVELDNLQQKLYNKEISEEEYERGLYLTGIKYTFM